jgi:hypothetical protein
VTLGQDMRRQTEARLRGLLEPGEDAIAVGTCEELHAITGDVSSAGSWRFVVVTPVRVLFANWGRPEQRHDEIAFDDVFKWGDGRQYHRYVLVLYHPPMSKETWSTPRRFLNWTWGGKRRVGARDHTIFAFSRADTKTAVALREQLASRNIGHEEIRLEEKSREERTRGSRVLLTATKKDDD